MFCMEHMLPSTKILTLKSNGCKGVCLDDYKDEDEPPPIWAQQYIEACKGDSGSGQFITNGHEIKPENFNKLRAVLTSVYTQNYADAFVHAGKTYGVPCGTYSYDAAESKQSKRVYFKTLGVSQSITYSKTLNWIKKKAKL